MIAEEMARHGFCSTAQTVTTFSIGSSLLLSALIATVGCGGATDASGPRETSNGDGASRTRPAPATGSLTEECAGEKGLTGNAVLDKLDVPTTAIFSRFPPEKPYGYPDPATSTRTTIRVRYTGGGVRCNPGGDTSGATMNPNIVPASVAVVVSVDFTTEDGLFDEHVQGELSATMSDRAQRIELTATIPVAALGGSYKKTAEVDGVGPSVPMKLLGSFTKGDLANSGGAVNHGDRFVGTFRFDS